jgi:hypothetical protein
MNYIAAGHHSGGPREEGCVDRDTNARCNENGGARTRLNLGSALSSRRAHTSGSSRERAGTPEGLAFSVEVAEKNSSAGARLWRVNRSAICGWTPRNSGRLAFLALRAASPDFSQRGKRVSRVRVALGSAVSSRALVQGDLGRAVPARGVGDGRYVGCLEGGTLQEEIGEADSTPVEPRACSCLAWIGGGVAMTGMLSSKAHNGPPQLGEQLERAQRHDTGARLKRSALTSSPAAIPGSRSRSFVCRSTLTKRPAQPKAHSRGSHSMLLMAGCSRLMSRPVTPLGRALACLAERCNLPSSGARAAASAVRTKRWAGNSRCRRGSHPTGCRSG